MVVHPQGRPECGRTARTITCEDFKYGVSRTFATDVITGGPNYILGYLDVPEDADGPPVYKGPYTGEGQDDFDKAVTCDGNTITYRFKKPWPDFPLAIASLRCVRPLPGRQGQGRQVRPRRSSPTAPTCSRASGTRTRAAPTSATRSRTSTEDTNREAQPGQVRLPGRHRDRGHLSTGSSPTPVTTQTRSRPARDRRRSTRRSPVTSRPAAVNFDSPFVNYLLPNFNRITNLKVRQALALATDRAARGSRSVATRPGAGAVDREPVDAGLRAQRRTSVTAGG